MFSSYRAVLALPGVRLPMFASFLGRLPVSMLPLATIALVESVTGSYADAGFVAASFALGSGIGGPLQGRLVDRIGQPRVLVPAAAVCAALTAGLLLAARAGASTPALVAIAAPAGFAFPPVGACMRTLWASLLRGDERQETAFALDAITVEAVFIGGPLLVGVALAAGGVAAPVLLAIGLLLVGTLSFAATGVARAWRGTGARSSGLGALRAPGMRVMVGAMLATAVAFGTWNVGFSAFTIGRGQPGLLGALFAAAAGGSLVGGLWYGSRSWSAPASRRYPLLLGLFALGTTPLGLARSVPQLAAMLFLACLWIAPAATVGARLIDRLAPAGTATEAYALVPTADVVGVSIGSSLAGILVETAGVATALSSSFVGIALGTLLVTLRRHDLAPMPTGEAA